MAAFLFKFSYGLRVTVAGSILLLLVVRWFGSHIDQFMRCLLDCEVSVVEVTRCSGWKRGSMGSDAILATEMLDEEQLGDLNCEEIPVATA